MESRLAATSGLTWLAPPLTKLEEAPRADVAAFGLGRLGYGDHVLGRRLGSQADAEALVGAGWERDVHGHAGSAAMMAPA